MKPTPANSRTINGIASDRLCYLALLRDCSDWILCRIFWKLRSYLISKIENHVFGTHSSKDVRCGTCWHSRSHDAVIRVYDEPGNVIDTHKLFEVSLDPETRRCAGMVVPLSGDYGCHIVDAGEVFAGISDLQALETRLASIN